MGYFKLKNTIVLTDLTSETQIPESDYSFVFNNKFIQLEYVKEDNFEKKKQNIYPGLYKITNSAGSLKLVKAEFTKDAFLPTYSNVDEISNLVACFFNSLDVYKEMGIEVPKRNVLFYGPPGTGKTVNIQKCLEQYLDDKETACVIWETSAMEAGYIKEFISSFEYKNVKKFILVAEDLGGFENPDYEIKSDSSLLSLLDNSEKTFSIPTLILATTNYPENFAENIANRSGRFDDKFRIGFPSNEAKLELLKIYYKLDDLEESVKTLLFSKSGEKLTAAHIKEVYIRSKIRKISLEDSLKSIFKEIEEFENKFSEKYKLKMGI